MFAKAVDGRCVEGDRLQPPDGRARMTAGAAPSDDGRWPWLDAVVGALSGGNLPMASLHLTGPQAGMTSRLQMRSQHFMPGG